MSWLGFSAVSIETLALFIRLIRNHYEQTGQWPTPTQLRASMADPK